MLFFKLGNMIRLADISPPLNDFNAQNKNISTPEESLLKATVAFLFQSVKQWLIKHVITVSLCFNNFLCFRHCVLCASFSVLFNV